MPSEIESDASNAFPRNPIRIANSEPRQLRSGDTPPRVDHPDSTDFPFDRPVMISGNDIIKRKHHPVKRPVE
jgi:hypothetical protein